MSLDLPAAPQPKRGRLGDRFQVLGLLGRGGMGEVYHVLDERSGRELALKLVSSQALTGTRLERFQREGELTARLDHPGVVRVHEAGQVDGLPFLAYELVEGARTLNEVLPTLELRGRAELIRDAAQALGAAHAQGITHRDVKPGNLLVDGSGRLRVADFGLATTGELERLTRTGAMVGTPSYMAPEQVESRREAQGPHTDVWALGVVLYEAITGRLPFDDDTVGGLIVRIAAADFPRPRRVSGVVPPALEAVCLKALQANPARRYSDGAALARDLDRYLCGESVEAPGALIGRVRDSASWIAAALVIVGGLAGLVLAFERPPATATPRQPAKKTRAPDRPPKTQRTNQLLAKAPKWFQKLRPSRRPRLPLAAGLAFGAAPGEFHNVRDGSILVWIPAGRFRMGLDGVVTEEPVHEVRLTRGYFLGKYEVSWTQYTRFSKATGREVSAWAPGKQPAKWVNWKRAKAYCEWAGLRLPTEAEWEYAARGSDGRRYPWGNASPTYETACWGRTQTQANQASDVGAFPEDVSPFGCFDMGGNMKEWVADWYGPYPTEPQTDPTGPKTGKKHVSRGGSWRSQQALSLRATGRNRESRTHQFDDLSFRVCRSGR